MEPKLPHVVFRAETVLLRCRTWNGFVQKSGQKEILSAAWHLFLPAGASVIRSLISTNEDSFPSSLHVNSSWTAVTDVQVINRPGAVGSRHVRHQSLSQSSRLYLVLESDPSSWRQDRRPDWPFAGTALISKRLGERKWIFVFPYRSSSSWWSNLLSPPDDSLSKPLWLLIYSSSTDKYRNTNSPSLSFWFLVYFCRFSVF